MLCPGPSASPSFGTPKWALLVPVVILGGIYSGVFTPTEAAAIAVIYGLVVGMFVYKDLHWKDIPSIFSRSALTTATILIIIGTATAFGRILTINRVPDLLGSKHRPLLQHAFGGHAAHHAAAALCGMHHGNSGGHHYSGPHSADPSYWVSTSTPSISVS